MGPETTCHQSQGCFLKPGWVLGGRNDFALWVCTSARGRPGLQYKASIWYRGTCEHPNQGYKPDVEMKRNRLFYLELLSSPGKLKYAVLGSMLVILH